MNFSCAVCTADAGSSLVCRACLPHLSEYQRGKLLRVWHKIIVERDGTACVYCGHSAPTDCGELCGNHKETRRVAPHRILDIENGECVCKACNARFSYSAPTEAKKAAKPPRKMPVCKSLRCPLLAGDGEWCWKH